MADYFADIVGNISVTGSLVRIDFMTAKPASTKDQAPILELSHRVVMPLEGFLRSLELQEGVRSKLLADGVISKRVEASGSTN